MRRIRSWWPSAVSGLAGGATVTVGGAILHTLVSSVPFLPIAIAQVLVRTTPGRFDSFFIDRLGHGAMQLAIIGTCIAYLLLAAALGVAIPWVRRVLLPLGAAARAAGGPVAFLPLWVASVVLYPSNPQWVGRLAFAFITVPLYVGGGAVAGWTLDRLTLRAADQPADAGLTRRYFLRAAWFGAAGMLLGASPLAALIFRRPDPGRQRLHGVSATPSPVRVLPHDAQFARVAGLTPEVTSNDEFYVVNEDVIQPDIDPAEWRLSIGGMVDRPLTLTYEDLKSLPVVERYQTLECISNKLGGHLMSNAAWVGVPVAEILDRAGIGSGVVEVAFGSAGGYSDSMSVAQALDETTLIAFGMNDFVLPRAHGFPARVLGVGTYGMKNPKWLTNIEVVDRPYQGFWEQRGWSKPALVKTTSRIDTPEAGATLSGDVVPIAGVAFAGDEGILRVEVSTDGRRTWNQALLKTALSPFTWRLWLYRWTPPGPGQYSIFVRAYDGTGAVQVRVEAPPFPTGASGIDGINVTVA
ncbi:MAG TPA: molybdopterin-dependent oxidoreductase, partial [Actinomycetota bacterium]